MRLISNAAILALFLYGAEYQSARAYRLILNKRGTNSEDIDADDADITDGPVKNDNDLAVYSQAVLTDGKNVKQINSEAEQAKKDALEKEGISPEDLKMTKTVTFQNHQEQYEEKQEMDHPQILVTRQQQAEHPHKLADTTHKTVEAESVQEQQNTNMWAHAEKIHHKRQSIEVGEIETKDMSLSQKSEMLHQVANGAQQDYFDEQTHKTYKKTDEEVDDERREQADEVSAQVMDLEHMKFSAKEMNDFTALTSQSAGKTYYEAPTEVKHVQLEEKPKNFYEQLYEKSKQK